MADITLLPAAEQDYQEALAWYQARSAQAAAGFEAAVEVALQRIADNPELFGLCDDRHRFYVLRRYPYSVIYRIDQGDVLVIAIAHSRRSPSFWQGRS
ncbi:MAG TPA: type II toxin-antitoxin system RelE/ParE family toxin [Gemmataceae bacterium]|nr:type II toxin-antitoxin system RelE/ParE family toxin [Gemmataceae bacterium]